MNGAVRFCQGPVPRRSFLQVGALGLGSMGLASLLRARAAGASATSAPDTSVIFIWLPGGPPHMETYDMKPAAPADVRGEFHPIETSVPGMPICELLPRHARIAEKFTLIRSIAHNFADHGGGHKRFLTGRDPREPAGFVNDYPMVGSMVAKCREHLNRGVPNYVSGTDPGRDGIDVYSFGTAYLGPAYGPFTVVGDPSAPNFQVNNLSISSELETRLEDRIALLGGLDNLRRTVDRSGAMDAMDKFNQKAFHLLTSDAARNAFDLAQEPDSLRDFYGRHSWGQRALMARRLVEAGSSFVTMVMENPLPGQPFPPGVIYNWDSHAVNGHIFDDARIRLPIYDQAISALVEDLYDRGLDQKVLLVVTGEFGRTPRVTYADGRPGRDHWPQAMSVLVAGGGMRTGQVVGSTNSKGEHPQDRPLTPNDLWATVFRHLGIDPATSFLDHQGRPMPILPYGEPIAELG